MALIDDQMAVIGNDIGNLSIADQALDERYVDDACRSSLPTADKADQLRVHTQERLQAFHPLIEQLSSMN